MGGCGCAFIYAWLCPFPGKATLTNDSKHEGIMCPAQSPAVMCSGVWVGWCVWQNGPMQGRVGGWHFLIGGCLLCGWVQLGIGVCVGVGLCSCVSVFARSVSM